MTDELVTFTVDGRELKAAKGSMLIVATDAAGITIPRFCYHKKLSVAANCRMCLVDVEKAPKPMPACATPIMPGMIVHTKSARAIAAQKAVMEFLLINHPLDCPICDQGGECELQDVSMGFGQDVSQYADIKRVVFDKDIGPLISTELTRCIQCTRCIRFGEEIAGMRELGATDRGDRMVIGTFIEKSVDSELSGNAIDVCPVGALTAKPSRFSARAWELVQHPAIAPHDGVGSNIFVHTWRGKVVRVVPRENETLNEVWISDRDRYSYQGLYAKDRLAQPMIKKAGEWCETTWDEALQATVNGIQSRIKSSGADSLGVWVSPSSTLEELFLLQKITRGLGSGNIDHRLRQRDFSDQDIAPVMPWLGQNIESLEKINAALIIGSHVRKDQPMIAHRLRKAAVHNKAKISFVNPRKYDWHLPVANECVAADMVQQLAAIAKACGVNAAHLSALVNAAQIGPEHQSIADALKSAPISTVLLGNISLQHPQLSALRQLAAAIAETTKSILGYLPESANSAGAWLAGAVPHREATGVKAASLQGKPAADMACKAMITFNIEPELDCANGSKALATLKNAEFVVAISSYVTENIKMYADVILPLAAFAETSGTYVNGEGFWQGFQGVTQPFGDARPGWKILRVLGNLFNLENFDYQSSQEVKDELKALCQFLQMNNAVVARAPKIELVTAKLLRLGDAPIYAVDALVRRATALQKTSDAMQSAAHINSKQAQASGVAQAKTIKAKQTDGYAVLPVVLDENIPDGCIWIASATAAAATLGATFDAIEIEPV